MNLFQRLLSPIQIGPLSLSNRIVMPPMGTRLCTDSGGVSSNIIHYYRRRARGGVGMIIVESNYVNEERAMGHMAIYSDHFIPGLNMLAESIKEENCAAFVQLNHRGSLVGKDINKLIKNEIRKIIKDFGEGASRAKSAGFDGIEIHGGNVYLMHQFLSPKVNKRKDEFGRNLAGRMRLPLLILEECRAKVGDEFPIFFRLNADEFTEGGWDMNQARVLAKELERRQVTAIDVTAAGFEARYWHVMPMALPRGALVPLAAELKKIVKVPVMTVGRINDPGLAEEILQNDRADLIGVGRGLIADPDFPLKALKGHPQSINKCIACNYCRRVSIKNYAIRCAVNPMAGREGDFQIERPEREKKIWVIGGGPAGMTAARILSERDHHVSLFEANEDLGGQMRLAVLPPHKEEVRTFLDFLKESVKKSKVQIYLNKKIEPQDVREGNPDVVVLATGAKAFCPEGYHQTVAQKSAWEILEKGPGDGKKYLVIGGGSVGCETAEFLAEKGRAVTILEILPEIGADIEQHTRTLLLMRLGEKKVTLLAQTELIKIEDKKVYVKNKKTKRQSTLEAEVIVFAYDTQPDRTLYEEIKSFPCDIQLIGDALKPRRFAEAVFEGARIAYRI